VRVRSTQSRSTSGRLALVFACLAGAMVPGLAAAQATPPVPGTETARFRVVVEGLSRTTTDLDAGGTSGVCSAEINAQVTEISTYQRGRGVTVEFVRFGAGPRAPVILRRVGSFGPATFSVDVAVTRTATGFASRTPAAGIPQEACPPVTEDLSRGAECGKTETLKTTASLTVTSARGLRLRTTGLGNLLDIRCPDGAVVAATDVDLALGWPTPPKLRDRAVPLGQIFGSRRVIIMRLDSLQKRQAGPISAGPVSGSATHFGRNRATIRLIRIS